MHPDQRALLDGILAHPDDDTRRLVYADWLKEHGQEEHAEFIRVQIELDTCKIHQSFPKEQIDRHNYLCQREVELMDWVNQHDSTFTNTFIRVLRRGLSHSVICTFTDWQKHVDAILTEHPIREVRLTDMPIIQFEFDDTCFEGKILTVEQATLRSLQNRWPGPAETPITYHLPDA